MEGYGGKIKFQYRMLAKVYDLMDIILFPNKEKNPRLALAKHIPNDSLSVLDVCTGTGNSAISIAVTNSNNEVTGIDLSKQMLAVAGRKIKKRNLTNITLQYMDAAHIDINKQFDIVTTSLSLHEIQNDLRRSVVSGMAKVLKPNGRLYIIEWEKPKGLIGSIIFMIFPYLFEPKGFGRFLKINWEDYLKQFGLRVEGTEKYTFTKLIIATKN